MISLMMRISLDNVEYYLFKGIILRTFPGVKVTLFRTDGSPIGFYVHHAYSTTLVEFKKFTISPTKLQIAGLTVLLIIL